MIIIPARLGSTRLKNKVIEEIDGIPMVVRVAKTASKVDKSVVATDSSEVANICSKYDIESVMTSSEHTSGTLRVAEVVEKLKLKDDEVVINVQGDEPLIEQEVISALHTRVSKHINNREILACSCYTTLPYEEATDPNHVKVIIDKNENAIYFSRSKIPFDRNEIGSYEYNVHLGLYGFTASKIRLFAKLETSQIEAIEQLEQLKILYNGYKMSMCKVKSRSFGVDTLKDLNKIKEIIKNS